MPNPATWPCGHAAGCVPWSPGGRLVAGANADGGAVIWNPRTGTARHVGDETGGVIEAAFSPDGRRYSSSMEIDRGAQIWHVVPRPVKEGERYRPRARAAAPCVRRSSSCIRCGS